MGLLGSSTRVDARTGRKLNNALTLTFKSSTDQTIAVGAQVGSPWVLLGFKNTGDAGRFTLKGAGGDLLLDCRTRRTEVTTPAGDVVGSIIRDGDDGLFHDTGGSVIARLVGIPKEKSRDPTCDYPLFGPSGEALGTLSLVTTAGTFDLIGELIDETIYWEKAAPLKVPTLGTRLALIRSVDGVLGDLLLSACVTIALGPQAFIGH